MAPIDDYRYETPTVEGPYLLVGVQLWDICLGIRCERPNDWPDRFPSWLTSWTASKDPLEHYKDEFPIMTVWFRLCGPFTPSARRAAVSTINWPSAEWDGRMLQMRQANLMWSQMTGNPMKWPGWGIGNHRLYDDGTMTLAEARTNSVSQDEFLDIWKRNFVVNPVPDDLDQFMIDVYQSFVKNKDATPGQDDIEQHIPPQWQDTWRKLKTGDYWPKSILRRRRTSPNTRRVLPIPRSSLRNTS